MAKDPETSWRVAETTSGLGRRESVDEIGSKGFVLPMGGIGRLEEEAGRIG
jgi:hypothetical protein